MKGTQNQHSIFIGMEEGEIRLETSLLPELSQLCLQKPLTECHLIPLNTIFEIVLLDKVITYVTL